MKLDKRILPGKRPLGCFDTEEARRFEGEQGYFSDEPVNFDDGDMPLSITTFSGKLKLTEENITFPFLNMTNSTNYRFFLPAAWLKPEKSEIKWRPYTLDDFVKRFDLEIGTRVFLMRSKRTPENMKRLLLTGIIQEKDPDLCGVCLGGFYFKFSDLFNMFDVRFGKKDWQPFGVEDTSE